MSSSNTYYPTIFVYMGKKGRTTKDQFKTGASEDGTIASLIRPGTSEPTNQEYLAAVSRAVSACIELEQMLPVSVDNKKSRFQRYEDSVRDFNSKTVPLKSVSNVSVKRIENEAEWKDICGTLSTVPTEDASTSA
jgi:hypothetical protein